MFEGASKLPFYSFLDNKERIAKIWEKRIAKRLQRFPFSTVELHTSNRSGMVHFPLSNVSSTVLFIIAHIIPPTAADIVDLNLCAVPQLMAMWIPMVPYKARGIGCDSAMTGSLVWGTNASPIKK